MSEERNLQNLRQQGVEKGIYVPRSPEQPLQYFNSNDLIAKIDSAAAIAVLNHHTSAMDTYVEETVPKLKEELNNSISNVYNAKLTCFVLTEKLKHKNKDLQRISTAYKALLSNPNKCAFVYNSLRVCRDPCKDGSFLCPMHHKSHGRLFRYLRCSETPQAVLDQQNNLERKILNLELERLNANNTMHGGSKVSPNMSKAAVDHMEVENAADDDVEIMK